MINGRRKIVAGVLAFWRDTLAKPDAPEFLL
jgi:hypothetical protein